MKLLDKKTAQSLVTVLVFGLALLFVYAAWRVLIAFLFAIFFAYLLDAPISRLQPWLRGSRNAAIAVVYAILTGGLVLVLIPSVEKIVPEAQTLAQQTPQLIERISEGQFARQMASQHGWSETTYNRVQSFLMFHRPAIVSAIQNLILRGARTLQGVWWLFLVPLLAIFFLKDGREFGHRLVESVENPRNRQVVAATVEQMNTMLGDFLRAQLVLSALSIVVITGALSAMQMRYGLVLGPVAGALEFIPVVGPVVGGLVVLVVAFLTGSHVVIVLIFLLVWRLLQDYVNSPRILGDKLKLHPLAVLFGVLAGGEVAGVIGVFLSIPVLATLRILWHTWQLYRRDRQPAVLSSL